MGAHAADGAHARTSTRFLNPGTPGKRVAEPANTGSECGSWEMSIINRLFLSCSRACGGDDSSLA